MNLHIIHIAIYTFVYYNNKEVKSNERLQEIVCPREGSLEGHEVGVANVSVKRISVDFVTIFSNILWTYMNGYTYSTLTLNAPSEKR